MTEARNAIFSQIRRSLDVSESDTARVKTANDRLKNHPRNLVPERGQKPHDEQVALFRQMAEGVQATIAETSLAGLPQAVSDYLRQHNLPQSVRMGNDSVLNSADWQRGAPGLAVEHGPADPADEVAITRARTGVAESGTLIMTSGADNPVTLNFLPENSIAVVRKSDIVGSYEDAFDRLRAVLGEGQMPRTLNMITGPSRTGDIEQKIELGAHGPRRLHIIILED